MSWGSFFIGFLVGAPIWATFGAIVIALLRVSRSDNDEQR